MTTRVDGGGIKLVPREGLLQLIMLSVAVGVLLAYANGANDNFKGVATLLGSGITDFRRAIHWGTAST